MWHARAAAVTAGRSRAAAAPVINIITRCQFGLSGAPCVNDIIGGTETANRRRVDARENEACSWRNLRCALKCERSNMAYRESDDERHPSAKSIVNQASSRARL